MSTPFLQENRGPETTAIIIPVSVLATLAVIGRLASRKIKNLRWEADDWTCVFALVLVWSCCGFAIACIHYGVGRHIQVVSAEDLYMFRKLLYAFNLVYVTTPPTIKMCILLMYKRIFSNRQFYLAVVAVGSVLLVWWMVAFIMGIVNCLPVQSFWNKSIPGHCINFENYSIGYAVVNISTDVIILTLPMRVVWNLQLPKGQKIALTFIFLLGSFVCAASLIRLLSAILNLDNPDATWAFTNAMIWTVIEPAVGVICACLPVMRPLINVILPARLRRGFMGPISSKANNSGTNSRGTWPTSKQFSRLEDKNGHGLTHEGSGQSLPLTTVVQGGTRKDSESGDDIMMNAIHVKQEFEVHAV